jgi:predicted HicB family RNase H-like nuclease
VTEKDDGLWIGSVNNIKEAIRFEGGNLEELEKNFHTVIDDYINKHGEPKRIQ